MKMPVYSKAKRRLMVGVVGVAGSMLLSGCLEKPAEPTTQDNDIPQLTMDLPVTLSGVISSGGTTQKAVLAGPGVLRAATIDECTTYIDGNANPEASGYEMTRFLVGLSQAETCVADFLMASVVGNASLLAGSGLITLPSDPNDPGAPSHLQVERSGDTYQVWLYFSPNGTLDTATAPVIYLTWTSAGSDVSGQFYFARIADSTANAPANMRVDFDRTASTASNKIYLEFAAGSAFNGFRVDVTQTGTGTSALYDVKGRMEFAAQPVPNLPTGEDFGIPGLSVKSVADDTGAGASIWAIEDLGFDFSNPTANVKLGSYRIKLQDTSYFDATGTVAWQTRGFSEGTYVNTSGTNTRLNATSYLGCLEGTGDCGGGIMGMNLGTGYFTNTCTDMDGADCMAYMQGYYDQGVLGAWGQVTNSIDAEPADWRPGQLAAVMGLTSVSPDGEDPTMTYTVPDAP